jgi:DNA-binding NarL/FixJ family response regulator
MTVRVLIADDHPLVRQGLQAALAPVPDMEIVAEAATGSAAIREAALHRPNVVVMDLQMPDRNGIDATRELRRVVPSAAVLVLTTFDDDDSVFAAMRAGAPGYVLRDAEHHEIPGRSWRWPPGEAIFGPAVATRVLAYFTTPPRSPTPFPELTAREREVLDLITAGHTNHQIAQQLTLSGKPVANHLSAIFAKLQLADRTQAVLRAAKPASATPNPAHHKCGHAERQRGLAVRHSSTAVRRRRSGTTASKATTDEHSHSSKPVW